jgi:NhaA family Na+:H+ antiporter
VLAGTGFTVSLLLAQLSFAPERADRVVLAVLAASVVASALGALAVRARRSAHTAEQQV